MPYFRLSQLTFPSKHVPFGSMHRATNLIRYSALSVDIVALSPSQSTNRLFSENILSKLGTEQLVTSIYLKS